MKVEPERVIQLIHPYVPHHSAAAAEALPAHLTRTIGARARSPSHIYSNQTEMIYTGLNPPGDKGHDK
jgi:hypothetical protein